MPWFRNKSAKHSQRSLHARTTNRETGRDTTITFEPLENRQMMSATPALQIAAPMAVDPIQAKYAALGGSTGFLGAATSNELPTPYGGGLYQLFKGGSIFYSPSTGAHDLYGPVQTEFFATKNEVDARGVVAQRVIGLPTSDEAASSLATGARTATFQFGTIDWTPATGAHVFYRAIADEYAHTASETDGYGVNVQKLLGAPTSDEVAVPDVAGARTNTFQHGVIYWSPATGAHVDYGAIKAVTVGGEDFFGLPTTDEAPFGGVAGLRATRFQKGTFLWSAATGVHLVSGAIGAEYDATASEKDAYGNKVQTLLGLPTSDEMNVPGVAGARMNTFQHGAIYLSPGTGAHVVFGAIRAEYNHTASEVDAFGTSVQQILGLPTSDEISVPGVAGARECTFQHGTIYWSSTTGAHVIYGAIGAKFNASGGPVAQGLPISDEADAGVPSLRVTNFHSGAAIYCLPSVGTYLLSAPVAAKYLATAGDTNAYGTQLQSLLGAPTNDETDVPGIAGGRMNTFQGGTIYWSASTGAHVVYGGIGAEYNTTASETDYFGVNVQHILGLPTSDETNVPFYAGARMNTFQGGKIYWSASTGAHVVYGGINALYSSFGGPRSGLGLPTTDELGIPGGRAVYFERGNIVWDAVLGANANFY
jgi:uncharacterized protein with LGFP repeats